MPPTNCEGESASEFCPRNPSRFAAGTFSVLDPRRARGSRVYLQELLWRPRSPCAASGVSAGRAPEVEAAPGGHTMHYNTGACIEEQSVNCALCTAGALTNQSSGDVNVDLRLQCNKPPKPFES